MIEVVIFQWLLICHILQRGWVIEVCFLCYATFEFTLSHPSIQVWCLTSILDWGSLCRCIIWEFHIPIISRAGGRPRMPQQLTPTKKWWPKAFSHSVVLHPDSRYNPPKIKQCTRAWDAQKATNPFSNCRMMYIIGLSRSEFRNWLSDCFVSAAVDPHSWWSWAWSHPWKSFPVLSCNFQISHWIWCDTKNIRFRSEYQNFLAISNDWLFPQLYKKGPSGPFYAIYLVSIPLHHLQLMRPFASPRRRASTRQSLAAKAEPAASKPASCIKNFHSRMQDYKLSVHFVEKVSGTNISQVSLVTCAKGFSTRTPHSMYSTVQPIKSSKALVCTTTFNRLKDELLTIFITDPSKKKPSQNCQQRFQFWSPGHLQSSARSSAVLWHSTVPPPQQHVVSTAHRLGVVPWEIHPRPRERHLHWGRDKKKHGSLNCHLCGGYWMGDGYQVQKGWHLKCF